MKTVQYGKWKIEVDVEKTKEYYNSYVSNDNQANRNFAEYCKNLSKDEKAFFEAFGIIPEKCEIEHIGANKKKEFPCGGYYLICGKYIEAPKMELLTVEEFVQNGCADEREDPRINVGIFQFAFQCEDDEFNRIPEDMPSGFICVRFWCEEMKWLLSEKPEVMMFEQPKFWEIFKKFKIWLDWKKSEAMMFKETRNEFIKTFQRLGIKYMELNKREYRKYKKNWVSFYSPKDADRKDQKEIKKICLSKKMGTPFLWHLFTYEFLKPEENASELFDVADKKICVFLSNLEEIGFIISGADGLTSEVVSNFIDVTMFSLDFSWTYCQTHEEYIGPFFYKCKGLAS